MYPFSLSFRLYGSSKWRELNRTQNLFCSELSNWVVCVWERGGGNGRGRGRGRGRKKVEIVPGNAGVWKLIKVVNQHQSNQRLVTIELKINNNNFIEVCFSYYKIYPFQVYECWNHHCNSILEHFHSQIRSLMPIYILLPFSPLTPGNY